MAKKRLSPVAMYVERGYGQVEPNHLSAQHNGQIYAQLPAAADIEVLENGQFVKYDYANNEVNFSGDGEWMLVFNEVKLYDERLSAKDFAMIRVGENYVTSDLYTDGYENSNTAAAITHADGYRMDGFAPRLFKTNIGDIMTTNMVKTGVDYEAGDLLAPKASGKNTLVLETVESAANEVMVWAVVKVYTMPDGQAGLKLQRVK